MGIRRGNLDLFEKSVASMIDVASVLVAYNIGMDRLGLAYGVVYAGMDAFVVVWLSRPITGIVRRLNPARRARRGDGGAPGSDPLQPPQTVVAASLPVEERRVGGHGADSLEAAGSIGTGRAELDD
ncbi:MAG: hypothetical protein JRN46_01385 [Nitrososphaerota archaeon]|nr:hypothetical protein [Nitrososphaerota archaeon]